jgi:hypothetical protein
VATDVIRLSPGPADFDPNIVSSDPSRFPQLCKERGDKSRCDWIIVGKILKNTDAPHAVDLLSVCHVRSNCYCTA